MNRMLWFIGDCLIMSVHRTHIAIISKIIMTRISRDYRKERTVAVDAAWSAARLIRAHVGRLHDTDIRDKGVSDLVTTVDEASEALLIQQLRGAFPAYDVLAEESGGKTPSECDGYRWIIDPIDGTTNFAHALPPFAVSIALQREEEVVLGVVLEVSSGQLFTAVRGHGAFCNGVQVSVSQRATLAGSVVATGFPYRTFSHVGPYLDVLRRFMAGTRGVRRFGAASYDLALVASGRFDGFFETGLHAWDVAAGTLLVEEAGGRVTDHAGKGNPVFARQIVASNGVVHDEMLTIVQAMCDVRA